MKLRSLITLILLSSTAFAQSKAIDWKAIDAETLRHFTTLIKTDTSNPPGHETLVAKYLQGVLEREGIPTKLVGANPDRLSLIARLKGNGTKKPILIMGHTDVVGVQRERWAQDPFGAARIDGYIWGRGTIDDKDLVVGALMTILQLKRSGVQLDRDVIYVAEAGEEGGSPDGTFGIQYIIKNNWPDIDAEYCLTEGGEFRSVGGKVMFEKIEVTEKVGRGMRLVAHGTAGHGSMPREDNAIVHLSAAVAAIGKWQPPMHFTDVTRTYVEGLAKVSPPEEAARLNALFDSSKTAAAQDYFRKNNIEMNSILRTSVSPNIINGGFRSNVIPSEATATLDIRAIPDEDMDKFKAMMTQVINDPAVTIESNGNFGGAGMAPVSSLQTEMYQALTKAQQKIYPGIAVLPWMATGATDMRGLRLKGMQSYGIGAEIPQEDLITHAMHSDNERIKESGLYAFVHYFYEAVSQVAAK
ncbi:MAG: M20/M25/M40 family metallo-hydrolase [Bryobacteraceae bacterium]|jgi:acetylornithine deacetylase/succinyl-diaminopimelate desuccinylase-like protein